MQNTGGRRGPVMSIRFSDLERSLLEKAVAVGNRGRFYGHKSLGSFIRDAALAAASKVIDQDKADEPVRKSAARKTAERQLYGANGKGR